jgi:hypothetical protein
MKYQNPHFMKTFLQARSKTVLLLLFFTTSFSFISFAQPANDIFTNATTLNSGTVCVTTAGTLASATVSAPAVATTCGIAGGDVWYQFIAQSTYPTISLSGAGALLAGGNSRLQLFSGSYGALTSLGCVLGVGATATLSVLTVYPAGLTPGSVYYVRVYSNTAAPVGAANWTFNICITDPLNDLCSSSILLTPGSSCTAITGTLTGSTYTAMTGVPGCGTVNRPDVWYKFVAQSTNPAITLTTGIANPRITLFTGDCTAFTSSVCGTTSIAATGLTIGSTYYIRVYSTTVAAGNFTICITEPGRLIGGGNSYVNVSKRTVGGIVQTGDTLEIRSSFYWNSSYDASGNLTLVRFYDSVPTRTTMLNTAALGPVSIPGDTLLRVITNEGLTVTTNKFTYANADDAGAYNAAPGLGLYQIRMNIGALAAPWVGGATPATAALAGLITNTTGGGSINPNTTLPLANGGTLTTASYFVKVTGATGDTIRLATPVLAYRKASAALIDTLILGTPYKIIISPTGGGLCPNATGVNIASEFSGTFGSGSTKERPTTLTIPIPAYSWRSVVTPSMVIGDGSYGIVNNLSQTGSTNSLAWNKTSAASCTGAPVGFECAHRMFGGFWDIIGDHTGTNNAVGNPPPAPGTAGGYMLAVNADFTMSEAFKQTLTGLCPNTYYEYSAWVKNVCRTCGIDVNGSSTYKPGVLPNLTFSVDGIDYFSSGSVDTVGWVRKGFIFKTDTAQTSAIVALRNNAPGGGGNDWVLDDIGVSVCLPNMKYSPSLNPNVCRLNPLTITDTISSIFDNYVYYKWQRSTDNGATWTDVTAPAGPAAFNISASSPYTYSISYTIPTSATDTSDNGDRYRVIVGTTLANLSSANCQVSDGISIINLSVTNCGTPLKTDLLSFNGKLVNDKSNLSWTTSKEEEPLTFTIERSNDGSSFTPIGTVQSRNNYTAVINSYTFIDPVPVTGKVYYRLAMTDHSSAQKYSRTIQLTKLGGDNFGLVNVINPFNYSIEFDVTSPADTKIDVELIDMFGKRVRKNSYQIHAGVNALSIPDMENLPSGTYIFRIKNNEVLINRKVLKKSF